VGGLQGGLTLSTASSSRSSASSDKAGAPPEGLDMGEGAGGSGKGVASKTMSVPSSKSAPSSPPSSPVILNLGDGSFPALAAPAQRRHTQGVR
jgi:hypothetical protein